MQPVLIVLPEHLLIVCIGFAVAFLAVLAVACWMWVTISADLFHSRIELMKIAAHLVRIADKVSPETKEKT